MRMMYHLSCNSIIENKKCTYLSVNAISSTTEVPVFAFQESESDRRLQCEQQKCNILAQDRLQSINKDYDRYRGFQ